MKLLDALHALQRIRQPLIETADAAAILQVENAHASKILARLAESGHLTPLRRGLWGFPGLFDVLMLPERLTAPQPAYVSLQSALYYHGMISQIPAVTYAVSLARTRLFKTPVGEVSIHHIAPSFFFGFEVLPDSRVKLASPEKALLDYLYLFPARNRLFHRLPELEFPSSFDPNVAMRYLRKISSQSRRQMVEARLIKLIDG